MNSEITVTFFRERHRFENPSGDVIVGDADVTDGQRPPGTRTKISIIGPDSDFERSQQYRLYGFWTKYKNKRTGDEETQFKFSSAILAEPHSEQATVRYIASACRGMSLKIGPKAAQGIWDAFGHDAVRMLREHPVKVADKVRGVSNESAIALAGILRRRRNTEDCSIELIGLLDRRGFPKATPQLCLNRWGNRAPKLIERNPYLLMQFPGIGFKSADAMYVSLGKNQARLKRQALCAWHAINSDGSGSTWLPAEQVVHQIFAEIGGTECRPVDALRLAKRAGLLATRWEDKQLYLAEARNARDEEFVAAALAKASQGEAHWPTVDNLTEVQPKITAHQLQELHKVTRGKVGLYGGTPGTGKSWTAAALVSALMQRRGKFAVCAPTGKAAVRITDAMAEIGVRARTIHSLLGVNAVNGGWGFVHGPNNPLPYQFIIVDESSMISLELLASFLAAVSDDTHILFVGDVQQLSPVGHGAPLRDMIAAGLPYGELREIQRNSGRIVRSCAQMRDGERFAVSPKIDLDQGENLGLIECHTPEEQINALTEVFATLAGDPEIDRLRDVQVLVPVNKRSKVSREALNAFLQEELNPLGETVEGCPFRVGDKIVNNRNGLFGQVDGGECYVANGEIGRVIELRPKIVIAELESPSRVVKILRGSEGDTGCSWDLAYALSTHKAQGSEWPVIILILDTYAGARQLCDQSWLYTGISRAKKLCLMLGKIETAYSFARQARIGERKTFLAELIGNASEDLGRSQGAD